MALKFEYNEERRMAVVCGVEDKSCEQIVIPSTVEYYRKKYDVVAIKYEAFKECIKLKSVTIPDSVTSIGYWAFYGCSSLKEFKGEFAADNGRCLIKDGVLIAYARASGTTYDIPNGVTKIEMTAFSGCSSLTSVTIPDSVTVIGWYAFSGCSSLTSINIPNSVTEIGWYAFSDCRSLTSVTIPNSVTEIGCWAFDGCSSLKEVEICNDQGSVKIDSFAFGPDVKVTYLGKDAQPKPKQEVKEQPAPEVATPAPTIDLDKLIDAAVADGVITDKERSVILKRAVAAGYDADEVEILLDGKIAEKQRDAQPKKKGFFARLFGKK